MTFKELSIEQMEHALSIDRYAELEPHNAMTRLKLHAEVGRLYASSMHKRKMRSDLLNVEVKFIHQEIKSKLETCLHKQLTNYNDMTSVSKY